MGHKQYGKRAGGVGVEYQRACGPRARGPGGKVHWSGGEFSGAKKHSVDAAPTPKHAMGNGVLTESMDARQAPAYVAPKSVFGIGGRRHRRVRRRTSSQASEVGR